VKVLEAAKAAHENKTFNYTAAAGEMKSKSQSYLSGHAARPAAANRRQTVEYNSAGKKMNKSFEGGKPHPPSKGNSFSPNRGS